MKLLVAELDVVSLGHMIAEAEAAGFSGDYSEEYLKVRSYIYFTDSFLRRFVEGTGGCYGVAFANASGGAHEIDKCRNRSMRTSG